MASKRELALAALAAVLLETGAEVWRDTDINRDIPPQGLIQLAEGDALETPLLSPIAYDIEQQAVIFIAVTAADEPARDAALDALLTSLHTLIIADRTLGGAVDDTTLGSPSFEPHEIDGAGKIARLTCTLSFYVAGSPNG